MRIELPSDVEVLLKMLHNKGFEAYVVGGCVRDSLLGRTPNDWDVCTNAKPDEILDVFSGFKVIPTGLKHGTITVMINNSPYEITTFRVDGEYSDNRRPDSVEFTDSLKEDLSRRDFTINSMAYSHKEGLVDPFNGQKDLEKMTIRCVGDAYERLENEDRLRKLRAVRFASQLGFHIHPYTYSTIKNSPYLNGVSIERIQCEFNKILLSKRTRYGINLLYELKLLDEFLPELCDCMTTKQNNPYHIYPVGLHSLIACGHIGIQDKLYLKLAVLLHDIGKPLCKTTDGDGVDHFYEHGVISAEMAVDILKRLKYDNDTIDKVKTLVLYHDADIHSNVKSIKRWLNKIGEDAMRDLLKIREADIFAQNPEYYFERYEYIMRINNILDDIVKNQDCFSRKDLTINGYDLMKIGIPEGREIGNVLDILLDMVIENPELNTNDRLMNIALRYIE